jgi:cytochrome c-type protein NapB
MSEELPAEVRARALHVGGAAVVALAVVGFFTGVQGAGARVPRAGAAPAGAATVKAPSDGDLRRERRGPNASRYVGAVARLGAGQPGLFDDVVQSDEDRARALTARGERRAYDGAPPTIPHAIQQNGPPDCLACHQNGATIAGRRAPRMSHESYASCTQCHVSTQPRAGETSPVTASPESTFTGLASPARGERAWPGAPPTIPHPTKMRGECGSCHGTNGAPGMRSTHPYRQSCTQCHAPSAALDQRAAGDARPPAVSAP